MCTDERSAVVRATHSVRLRIDERPRRSERYAYSTGIGFTFQILKTVVRGGSYASSYHYALLRKGFVLNGFATIALPADLPQPIQNKTSKNQY